MATTDSGVRTPLGGGAVWAVVVLGLLALASFLVWSTYDEYEATLAQENRFLESYARFGDAQISDALRSVNLLLERVIDDQLMLPALAPAVVQSRQLKLLQQFREIHFLITTDSQGQVRTAESLDDPQSVEKVRSFNASQREYFTVHRDAPAQSLNRMVVSRPFKTITQRDTITLSRAMRDADGRFLGVALVSLSPAYFDAVIRQTLPQDASSAAILLNRQGDAIYRLPDPHTAEGKSLRDSPAFQSFKWSEQRLGRYMGPTVIDQSDRMVIFSRIADTDLAVGVSRQVPVVLANWRSHTLLRAAGFMVIAGVTCALAWVTGRRIKERKRAVDEVQQLNATLESKVLQRTEELRRSVQMLQETQDELIQSGKLASLGSMVAGISHELNTPIGNTLLVASTLQQKVQSFSHVLQRHGVRKSEIGAFFTDIGDMSDLLVRSCGKASELISSFKQVAIDQTSERRRSFELHHVVDDVLKALRVSYRHTVWVLQADIPAGMVCDSFPGPLGQVLTNLVQNACRHGFHGRVDGIVCITATRQDDGTIALVVQDDGVGMDTLTLSHVFDPFFTTQLGAGGSGLGLSVSRRIVESILGGSLRAESTLGYGSRFICTFPPVAPGDALEGHALKESGHSD